mmetsp:Transcript_21157/g.22942  ORF Transcript_21157/g.22942 Transcript_21157/m.22942 type:complete len:118 (-) Transcript_21157:875-1228(-)
MDVETAEITVVVDMNEDQEVTVTETILQETMAVEVMIMIVLLPAQNMVVAQEADPVMEIATTTERDQTLEEEKIVSTLSLVDHTQIIIEDTLLLIVLSAEVDRAVATKLTLLPLSLQ